MCFSTAYWARVSRIVFGARIGDAVKAGFSELRIPVARMKEVGRARVRVKPGYMARECRGLFRTWLSRGLRPY
jgi:tRNA(Arg) A34 adenosine deaminase TadA